MKIRRIKPEDYRSVAKLICESTNAWYQKNGNPAVFPDGPESTMLFCEVYEALDQGNCVLAEDVNSGRLMGSCFFHPRPAHLSLGIMNVHADFFGQGVARNLLTYVTNLSDELGLPVRLVSSALNLDSFSLYSRAGFVPIESFQDMILTVPDQGLSSNVLPTTGVAFILRDAVASDVQGMVDLERKAAGIDRAKDFRFFIDNDSGYWHVTVAESAGKVCGFVASIAQPASSMIGPAVFSDPTVAVACLTRELNHRRGQTMVLLIPTRCRELVDFGYAVGARNCEIHFSQVRGSFQPIDGIVMPTFMPETG